MVYGIVKLTKIFSHVISLCQQNKFHCSCYIPETKKMHRIKIHRLQFIILIKQKLNWFKRLDKMNMSKAI